MTSPHASGPRREWLIGGGELGDLIRALDWSATPLGPRDAWPSSLQAIVNLVVSTSFPMALLWGHELTFIYNNGYREIAGDRHPRALGRSTRKVWPEVWRINEPIFAAVMGRGETLHFEDKLFPIERRGRREGAYFTLCYSPVRIEDGTIGGTLVTLQETTARLAERGRLLAERQAALDTFEHGEACIVLDRDYRVILVNEEQERISGKPRGTTLGRLIWDVWPDHADPASPFRRAYDRVMRERRATTFEEYFAPLSAWLYVRVHPTANGGLAAFFHDTTARRVAEDALRDSEVRFRALTAASSDVVYRMSPDWREMRNLSSGKFLTETAGPETNWMDKYIHPDDRRRVQDAIDDAVRRGRMFELEHRVVARDGGLGWTYSRAVPIKNEAGDVVEWFGVASDVTARKRAEEALRRSEADARARAAELERLAIDRQLALDAARMGWWHYDPATRKARYDARYTEIFGVSGHERANEELLALIHPDDLSRVWTAVEEALDPNATRQYSAEYRIVRPDGGLRWIDAHGAATFEGEGSARRASSLVGTVADITERKRAEEALRTGKADLGRAQALAHLGSWRWDLVHDSVAWSEELFRIFGVDPATFVPSNEAARERIHPDDRDQHAGFVAMALAGTAVAPFESRIIRPDGEERVVLASGFDLEHDDAGKPTALFGTILEITDRKRAEAAVRMANEELQALNERLQEADRRKNEFLAMLSHELRNPLAPIRNSLFILDRAAPESESARRAREVAARQVAHLTRLVDDLLDVTRIVRSKIELRRGDVDVAALVRRTAEDHRALMTERGLELRVQVPGTPVIVYGDETRLTQVVGNLLQNAAKFTPRGGQVTASVVATDQEIELRVSDTGVGIPSGLLPKVFEPFVQAEQSIDRSEGGLGLGLALVKGVVELHGGAVAAESAGPGHGTEMRITLPLPRAALPVGATAVTAAVAAPTRRRVLVVDDNQDAAQSLADIVEMYGHEAEVAFDGPSAVAMARANPPQVLLCDIGLPGMSGYEVAQALRAQSEGMKLIAVSGYALPDDVRKSRDAGFHRHVAKPVNPTEIGRLLDA